MREAVAWILQDWRANDSLYARLTLASFRLGGLRERGTGARRLALTVLYRAVELVCGRILGQAQLDPRATVGPRLQLPHGGNGIVLNASAELGADVILYHQVTIGTDPFTAGTYRAPRIGARVVIAAGAKVLGDLTVGDDAVIGANAVVRADVPARATAVGVPARVIERDAVRTPHPASGR